jgi:hypothetical protein
MHPQVSTRIKITGHFIVCLLCWLGMDFIYFCFQLNLSLIEKQMYLDSWVNLISTLQYNDPLEILWLRQLQKRRLY